MKAETMTARPPGMLIGVPRSEEMGVPWKALSKAASSWNFGLLFNS
jgi:hypothetical protein